MSKIIYNDVDQPVALITETNEYGFIPNHAEKFAKKYDLKVADIPLLIQSLIIHPKVNDVIMKEVIDTVTGRYYGLRDGDRSYEVWHSAGSLATEKSLKTFINHDEWVQIGKGEYNGQTIERRHLEDVKRGDVPASGTPYTIHVRIDKDNFNFNRERYFTSNTLMQDDNILMFTGSLDNREVLNKLIFCKKKEGIEARDSIINSNFFMRSSLKKQAEGYQMCFNLKNYDFCDPYISSNKCLLLVNTESLVRPKIVKPKLLS